MSPTNKKSSEIFPFHIFKNMDKSFAILIQSFWDEDLNWLQALLICESLQTWKLSKAPTGGIL